ncbi:MAG: flagellin FliC [Planctomycetes bacterium]|nr:flagellin FliC [Planctomycetota bacterium]
MTLRLGDTPARPLVRTLTQIGERLAGTMQKLASGLRIPSAAADPAGLAQSERLRARIRSMDQARRNAHDGVSMVQVADNALGVVADMLVRMREIAVQARNGTTATRDLGPLQTEYVALQDEITRITRATQWNGQRLLDGTRRRIDLQVGTGTTAGVDTLQFGIASLPATLNVAATNLRSQANAATAMNRLTLAIDRLSTMRGSLGAVQSRLQTTIANLAGQFEHASAAESRIRDVDTAVATAELARQTILQQATMGLLAQANAQPRAVLRLFDDP